MSRFKIFNIVGARPQFIKMAVVSRALKDYPELEEVVVHSGQHFDENMSQVFFDELGIPEPQHNLTIRGTGDNRVLESIEQASGQLMDKHKPDLVLVYGDTYTTLAAARAAFKRKIALAHVEAGLRSFNGEMPEEFNRVETDKLANYLFAPTALAIENLKKEGLDNLGSRVHLVGDVMFDAVKHYANSAVKSKDVPRLNEPYLLVTLHRAENTDNKDVLAFWVDALNRLSKLYTLVFPLHPRTANRMKSFGLRFDFPTHPPQSYLRMLALIQHSQLVITDSGGLQKEAFFLKKPCVTLRNETEWIELVKGGYNRLVGTEEYALQKAVEESLCAGGTFTENYYGDGRAGEKIARVLRDSLFSRLR